MEIKSWLHLFFLPSIHWFSNCFKLFIQQGDRKYRNQKMVVWIIYPQRLFSFWSISLFTTDFPITNLSRNIYALLQTSLGPHDKYELCTHNSHYNATLNSTHMTVHVVGLDNYRGHNTGWDTNFCIQ
jgi:hypothetical protein